MRNYILLISLGFFTMMSCGSDATKATSAAAKTVVNKVLADNDAINVRISNTEAKKGDKSCVSFVVNDFNQIMGYQHSIKFNPEQLKYMSARNFGLPNLNESNFGLTKAGEGTLNFLWFDMNVKGITIKDRSNLFDLCFEVLASEGAKCEISITDDPVKSEVVGPQKKKLKLNSSSGFINIQ